MNNKAMNFIVYIMLVFISTTTGCTKTENFYSKGSGWDYLRFPILEPYYAIKVSDDLGWSVPLFLPQEMQNFWYSIEIHQIDKMAVQNGIILLKSNYLKPIVIIPGEQERELHWFIVIPGKMEFGYETEQEFVDNYTELGIQNPNWTEPDLLLKQFDQYSCLDWYPNCE